MSTRDVTERKKTGYFAVWRDYPLEIKLMDLSSLAWGAIFILNIVLIVAKVEMNMRVFPTFAMPFFMILVTYGLRLKLVDKPENKKQIFITWIVLFVLMFLATLLILILYPPLIQ